MQSIYYQRALAAIFLGLGGWCLLFPGAVEILGLRPEFRIESQVSRLFIGCFGAQAVLCGTVIWASRFTPRTFLVFGLLGSIPFFAFNYYFYFVERIFSDWMLLDFVGNVGILVLCLLGRRASQQEHRVAA